MTVLRPGDTLGILGAGQLGRMLAIAAAQMGLKTHSFAPETDPPAAQVTNGHTAAAYTDSAALEAFAAQCPVITFEFENVPRESLYRLAGATALRPGIASLETSQDRLTEKRFLEGLGLPVAPYRAIEGAADIAPALDALGGDAILKTRRLGYDGKGQATIRAASDADAAWDAIGGTPAVLEARVPFAYEVSAILARGVDGKTAAFDVPVNRHAQGILRASSVGSFAERTVPRPTLRDALRAARTVADALDHVGVLTVEFFAAEDGSLLINEIAPRVHNSGHWTMDACLHDQFDLHIRAVAGWPLPDPGRHSDAQMTNLIGDAVDRAADWLAMPDTRVHLYGKTDARPGRKMGHVNRIAPRKA